MDGVPPPIERLTGFLLGSGRALKFDRGPFIAGLAEFAI